MTIATTQTAARRVLVDPVGDRGAGWPALRLGARCAPVAATVIDGWSGRGDASSRRVRRPARGSIASRPMVGAIELPGRPPTIAARGMSDVRPRLTAS